MFGSIKIVMVGLLITGIAGAGMYVMKLRSEQCYSKANQMKLEEAVNLKKFDRKSKERFSGDTRR